MHSSPSPSNNRTARHLRLCDCDCDSRYLAFNLEAVLSGVVYATSTPSTNTTEPGEQYRVRRISAINGVSSGAASDSVGSEAEFEAEAEDLVIISTARSITLQVAAAAVVPDMGACFDMGFLA